MHQPRPPHHHAIRSPALPLPGRCCPTRSSPPPVLARRRSVHADVQTKDPKLLRSVNATGFCGVYQKGNRFHARVSGGGTSGVHIGTFATAEEAAQEVSRVRAEREAKQWEGVQQPAAQTVDGLQLHLCATNATGYKGVTQSTGALKKQMEYLLARCSPLHSGMQLHRHATSSAIAAGL